MDISKLNLQFSSAEKNKYMETVLLVDDDDICNFIMTNSLENLGLAKKILSVLNGKQAIDLLRDCATNVKNFPELIFLDIDMPIMGGFAFLEAFKDLELLNKRDIRIVMVSSSDNPSDRLYAKLLGVTDFLLKPINEDKLKLVFHDLSDD